jgi:hypothetical protein
METPRVEYHDFARWWNEAIGSEVTKAKTENGELRARLATLNERAERAEGQRGREGAEGEPKAERMLNLAHMLLSHRDGEVRELALLAAAAAKGMAAKDPQTEA